MFKIKTLRCKQQKQTEHKHTRKKTKLDHKKIMKSTNEVRTNFIGLFYKGKFGVFFRFEICNTLFVTPLLNFIKVFYSTCSAP